MVQDTKLVLTIFGGASVTFLALGAAGWLLVRSLQRFSGAAGVACLSDILKAEDPAERVASWRAALTLASEVDV